MYLLYIIMEISDMKKKIITHALGAALLAMGMSAAQAEVVEVDMTVTEADIVIDNAGNTQPMWTFGGTIPGPVVRVTSARRNES